MATARVDHHQSGHKEQDTVAMEPMMRDQNRPISPPSYFVGAGGPSNVVFGGSGSDPVCIQSNGGFMSPQAFVSSNQGGPTVVVTQPVVVGGMGPPDTTCALVMSALSAVFCGFCCGAVGILLAWRAKLHVLERKYEHAHHSVCVVWLFLGLSCLFGVGIWILALYFYVYFSIRFYN